MIEELVRDIFMLLVQRRVINLDGEVGQLVAAAEQHVADAGGTPSPGAATSTATPPAQTETPPVEAPQPTPSDTPPEGVPDQQPGG